MNTTTGTTGTGKPGATTARPSKFLTQLQEAAKRHGYAEAAAGVTSPLDVLPDVSDDEVRAAVAATKRLG